MKGLGSPASTTPSWTTCEVLPWSSSAAPDDAAGDDAERLVPQAHPEHRHPELPAAADDVHRRPRLLRSARPGRDEHPVVVADRRGVDLVVADDRALGAELLKVA